MPYGSDYHDHPDTTRAIDEARWDAQRRSDELEERMNEMRRELTEYIRTEVEGLSEWIRRNADHDHTPAPAHEGGK